MTWSARSSWALLVPATAMAALALLAGEPQAPRLAPIPGQRDRANEPALAAALARLDPAAGGWEVEALAEAVSAQLDSIGDLVRDGSALDAASLSGIASAGFSGGSLRPAGLREVFRDGELIVRRAESAEGTGVGQQTGRADGAGGLARALEELFAPLRGARRTDVELLVTGVDVAEPPAKATVWAHARGRPESGSFEMTARLETRWDRPDPSSPPRLRSIRLAGYEEVEGTGRSRTLFADATQAVLGRNASLGEDLIFGVDHWLGRIESWIETDAFGHNGIAVGDVNGDGLDDLYVCAMAGLPNRLFVQNPDGTATERSAEAGVDWLERTRSALFLDLDNDGDEDLVVATSVALLFMENDGSGRFSVRASLSAGEGMVTQGAPASATRTGGIPDEGMEAGHYQRGGDFGNVRTSDIVSLAAADYDRDGRVDIYACTYHAAGEQADRFPIPLPYHDANNGGANLLIRNEGGWRFADATKPSGLDANNSRFSFAASWEDYDNDGDQDLYVANDFGRSNLYRNDGGRFVDVAAAARVENMAAGMSVSWADYDNDGWMDLYVGNMFSAPGSRIASQATFKPDAGTATRAAYQHHAMGNALYRNAGDGTFTDVSEQAGVAMGRWAWSSNFVDLDNDGWDDLVVANGYFTKQEPDDLGGWFWREVVAASPATSGGEGGAIAPYAAAWRDLARMIRRGRSFAGHERNVAFLNTRGNRFAHVSATTGLDFLDDGRAIAATDWDGDGDLDLWIANRTGPRLRFARNDLQAGRRWLSVRLEGRRSCRDAIGTRLELHLAGKDGGAGRRVIKTLRAGDGYLAQSSRWVHFGLGESAAIEKLVVRWPSGGREEFSGLSPDSRYRIVEGSRKAEPWPELSRRVALAAPALGTTPAMDQARILLSAPAPAPSLEYQSFDGDNVSPQGAGPILLILWSSADGPSTAQLREIAKRSEDLKAGGLRVLALNVDGVTLETPPDPAPARQALAAAGFRFEAGFAYPDLIDKLGLLQQKVIWVPGPFVLPSSILVDGDGLLAAIYKGPLPIDRLLSDLPALRTSGEKRLSLAIPFTGLRLSRGTPDFFDYMDSIAHVYVEGGYPDEAAAYFRKVIRIQPARAQAHFGLGVALASMGQTDEAVEEYRKTIELDARDVGAHNDLGLTLAGQGKLDEAIEVYRRALKIDPTSVATLCNLGAALAEKGSLDEAIASYTKALKEEPEHALALNNMAVALARQGKDAEAIEFYGRVLRVDPGNVAARVNLASALTRAGRGSEAIAHLEDAARLSPDSADVRLNLGLTLLRLGRAGAAVEPLGEATRLRPDLGQAQYYLSVALAKEGRTDEAIGRLADLMKQPADSPAVSERLAWVLAASPDAGFRDGAQAIRLAEQACRATGNAQPGPMDALGAAYAEAGRFAEAIDTARKAIDLATNSAGSDSAAAEPIRGRLKLYTEGKPYREGGAGTR